MDLPTTHYDNPQVIRESESKNTKSLLEKIASFVFLLGVLLSPLVFIPSAYAPADLVKSIFLTVFILVPCILVTLTALKRRTFTLPRHPIFYTSVLLIISILISSIFLSTNIEKSLIGQGFEVGTASFLILMFISAFFVSRLATNNRKAVLNIYSAIFISFIILAVFQIVRLFAGADSLTLGILQDLTTSVLGKWNDFGIFAGIVALLSFIGIKFFSQEKGLKWILVVSLVLSGFILLIVNSSLVWGSMALITFGIMSYEFYSRSRQGSSGIFTKISIFSLIVLVIAVALAWKGDAIAGPIQKHFNIQQQEVVLPWQLTLDVASDSVKESPLFGSGPNRFANQYFKYKPLVINQTFFWNTEFTNGFATIPSYLVTQGFVGIILWILFLFFLIRAGIKVLNRNSDPFKKFFTLSAFFVTSFLWLINLIYIPSHVILFLTFIFTGLLLAVLIEEGIVREKVYGIDGSGSRKLVPIISAIAAIVLIIWLGAYAKKTVAISLFQKGIKELNTTKSIDISQSYFEKALKWDTSDIYYQALSEINIIKISGLVQDIQDQASKNPGGQLDQAKIKTVADLIDQAVKSSRNAIAVDPTNYYNYISEARVSELGSSLGIANAYENARNSYLKSLSYNPYNPGIYLNIARLEASVKKYNDAQQAIGQSLQLKQNYTEAIFLLSQVQVANNQIKDAITSVQVATKINPSDPFLFFELGLLYYNDHDYTNAITALSKAVDLNAQYANAKYFLGLSYARLGENEKAINQFTELKKTNPDNQEVAFILTNIEAGKSPFADAQPPIDNKPEKRKDLPVTEKVTKDAVSTTIPAKKKK